MTTDVRPYTGIAQTESTPPSGIYIAPPKSGSRYHLELTYVRDGSTSEYTHDPVLAAKFGILADWWHADTDSSSIDRDKYEHEAYQRILELNKPVLRHVLADLRDRGGHWFKALRDLSGDSTIDAKAKNIEDARNAWLAWGKAGGLI